MSSPKVLAKLLQSLGSVTSNGATVFTGLHSYKANYILFLLSIAYVDTYTLTEIANVSRCEHLFSLGLIISHLELIWCSKTCRSGLQWQYRRMWNSLSLLQLPSSRFVAVPETEQLFQTCEHEEFSLEESPSRSNNFSRDEKVNAFSQLRTEKLVDHLLTWLPEFDEIKPMFTGWGSSNLFLPVFWGTTYATGQTCYKHLCLC